MKVKSITLILCIFSLHIVNISFAHSIKDKMCCTPTKSRTIPLSDRPSEYEQYNNVARKEGAFENPLTNKIIIKGIIKDKNCVPISNALIKVWQKDEYGVYRFLRAFVPTFEEQYKLNYQQYSTFVGTGTTVSNNKGEFVFITTIPDSRKKNHNSHLINISVEHVNYPNITTSISLGEHLEKHKTHIKNKRNYIWAKLKKQPQDKNNIRQNIPIYAIELVMAGISKYKKY